jgi:hypothetical protein
MKVEIEKYGQVAKEFAKSHSVGDEVWSSASYIEGFNQAVQWLDPDNELVLCPHCNTAHVRLLEIGQPDDMPKIQYPTGISTSFKCMKCGKEWIKKMRLKP